MKIKHTTYLLCFCFLIASLSYAQVYKWVDEKGVAHFTDDILQVPSKYRNVVESISMDQRNVEPSKNESPELTVPKGDVYKDSLGRGESYWRGRTQEWRKKLDDAQDKVEGLRAKYNEITEKFNASKSSAERANLRNERDQVKKEIDQYRAQMEEAKMMIDKKIPEEAELYKAKKEWIKP